MSDPTVPQQAQPTGPQQYAPQPSAPAPAQAKNGLGVAALVLGIIAVVFAFIPVVGAFIAIPLAIIALALGIAGLVRGVRGHASKGMPIAALILAVAALIIAIVATVSAASALDEAFNGTSTSADGSGNGSGGENGEAPNAAIGDPVTDGDMEFTVTDVETGVAQVGADGLEETADGQYVIVSVTVKNVGSEAAYFDDSSQYIYTADDKRYSADTAADISMDDANSFLNEINPGNSVKGKMAFDMPKDATPDRIELHGNMMSDGATVSLA